MEAHLINEKIATLVMGWHLAEVLANYCYTEFYWLDENDKEKFALSDFDPIYRIDHAWMVVEKAIGDGFEFELASMGEPSEGFYCLIGTEIENGQTADTAQEAICLAALKAKEGENE